MKTITNIKKCNIIKKPGFHWERVGSWCTFSSPNERMGNKNLGLLLSIIARETDSLNRGGRFKESKNYKYYESKYFYSNIIR